MELPAHLPCKTDVIEPENLPEGAIKTGVIKTEIPGYTPASAYVREILRIKYINLNIPQTNCTNSCPCKSNGSTVGGKDAVCRRLTNSLRKK